MVHINVCVMLKALIFWAEAYYKEKHRHFSSRY